MAPRLPIHLLVCALGIALAACADSGASSSEGQAFPEVPLETRRSESGALRIEVRTSPIQPPGRGTSDIEYRVTGEGEAPIEGLDLSVLVWMPQMGHGSSTSPLVEDAGEGIYVVSNVSFFMPGTWELRSTFQGNVDDHAVVPVDVR